MAVLATIEVPAAAVAAASAVAAAVAAFPFHLLDFKFKGRR